MGPGGPREAVRNHRVKCTALILTFQGVKHVGELEELTGFRFPRCQINGEEQGNVLWHRAEAGAETLVHHDGGQIELTWNKNGRRMTLLLPQGAWSAMTTEFA